jgi:acetone carboxylase gamma subunit
MATRKTDEDQIRKLVEGDLGWNELQQEVMPDPKDPNRFEVLRQILQERVEFEEPILVPLNDHLFVVGADDGRVIKGECGHEFCDSDENWREHSGIIVLDEEEEWAKLHSKDQSPDPFWQQQLRQYICPECKQQIAVDAVPIGYPPLRKFEPDIDTFYEEWLAEPAPDKAD